MSDTDSDDEPFMEKAFPVHDMLKNDKIPFDPNFPPTDALSYLKHVHHEASKLDKVVTVRIDESKLKKQTVVYKVEENKASASEKWTPSREWKICQVADFSKMRTDFAKCDRNCKRPIEMPLDLQYERNWCSFCFGVEFSDRLKLSGKSEEREESVNGNPPLMKYLLALSQADVEKLLEYHVGWLSKLPYEDHMQGKWLYALLVRLEIPLLPDVCSLLRTLAKECAKKKVELAEKSTEEDEGLDKLITSLNLIICIVSVYFRQLDLETLL